MKKIMKLFRIFLITVVGSLMVSCYNDFDMPSPAPVYNDETMEAMGMTHISIYDLKKMFGTIDGTGSTNVSDGLDKTMYKRFVLDEAECTDWEKQTNRYIVGNYYIKGKVISNDEQGNIYKSLYIYDGTAAIELKLSGTLYTTYKLNLDTKESTWVYVLLRDLYLGNYRMMLSLGDAPSDSYNVVQEHKFYANSNLELAADIDAHVLPGEPCKLEDGDILEVNSSNYTTLVTDEESALKNLGRLVRFSDITVRYAGVKNQNGEVPTAMKNGTFDNSYPTWTCTDVRPVLFQPWYRWAYSVNNEKLYASVLISYNPQATYTSDPGVYTVRTSGYSRFAMKPIPKDGAVGNVLGLFAIYSKQSTYSGGSRDYAQYQITVSRIEDLDFKDTDLLKEDWIEANTPAESYDPPVADDTGDDLE